MNLSGQLQADSGNEQRAQEKMQYIATFGEHAWQEKERNKLSAKELNRLRDELAIAAMQSLITIAEKRDWLWQQPEGFLATVANKSYMAADEMLKARELKS